MAVTAVMAGKVIVMPYLPKYSQTFPIQDCGEEPIPAVCCSVASAMLSRSAAVKIKRCPAADNFVNRW